MAGWWSGGTAGWWYGGTVGGQVACKREMIRPDWRVTPESNGPKALGALLFWSDQNESYCFVRGASTVSWGEESYSRTDPRCVRTHP